MKVKELIRYLNRFNPEYEVVTYVPNDESGTGTIYDLTAEEWDDFDDDVVVISFDFDGYTG